MTRKLFWQVMSPVLIWLPQHIALALCISNLSKLPYPIDQLWEITLKIPSWFFTFFGITRGLYICLKLRLHTYYLAEEKNKIALQTSFFRQAQGRSCWNGIRWDVFQLETKQGIVSDHCTVNTCANDIILTDGLIICSSILTNGWLMHNVIDTT